MSFTASAGLRRRLHLDLTGRQFGRWTVLYRAGYKPGSGQYWRCRCECGAERDVRQITLLKGVSRSCGCLIGDSASERRGPDHHAWKGDEASTAAKRNRARRRYSLASCERCGKPARDRHHKDGNTGNNSPENIQILCRSCHMAVDGRAERLADIVRSRPVAPPKPCRICQQPSKPLRKGRCSSCNEYFRYHGKEKVETC